MTRTWGEYLCRTSTRPRRRKVPRGLRVSQCTGWWGIVEGGPTIVSAWKYRGLGTTSHSSSVSPSTSYGTSPVSSYLWYFVFGPGPLPPRPHYDSPIFETHNTTTTPPGRWWWGQVTTPLLLNSLVNCNQGPDFRKCQVQPRLPHLNLHLSNGRIRPVSGKGFERQGWRHLPLSY